MGHPTELFKAFSDPTRLRILHLLGHGPLCVCHIHEILELPQAKVSRQLGTLRERGLVEATRHFNWTVYRRPVSPSPLVTESLQMLDRTVFASDDGYAADLERLQAADTSIAQSACCPDTGGRCEPEPAEPETLDTSLL